MRVHGSASPIVADALTMLLTVATAVLVLTGGRLGQLLGSFAFVVIAMASYALSMKAISLEARKESPHRRLRGEIVREGASGEDAYRSSMVANVCADGREHRPSDMRIVVTHYRVGGGHLDRYGVQIVFPDIAYETVEFEKRSDGLALATEIASFFQIRVPLAEIEHVPLLPEAQAPFPIERELLGLGLFWLPWWVGGTGLAIVAECYSVHWFVVALALVAVPPVALRSPLARLLRQRANARAKELLARAAPGDSPNL
jgi:hypothetical protein